MVQIPLTGHRLGGSRGWDDAEQAATRAEEGRERGYQLPGPVRRGVLGTLSGSVSGVVARGRLLFGERCKNAARDRLGKPDRCFRLEGG